MEPEINIHNESGGQTRVALTLDDECVSWLDIVPFIIRVGAAEVRMDGIANVNTLEAHRLKGYCRRVMEASVEHMTQGDAAISMLYGIGGLYPKFGYATVGPDHCLTISLDGEERLPAGWSVRPFTVSDLSSIRSLYTRETARGTGAAVRPDDHPTWQQIVKPVDELRGNACRVIVGSDGEVHAYAWLADWCYTVEECMREFYPDSFIVGEAIADSPASADALLSGCRAWAREHGEVKNVLLPVPPDSHVAVAAMYWKACLIRDFEPCGGSMIRVLSVKRLLEALRPGILARLQAARSTFQGALTIRTDIGNAALAMGRDGVRVEDGRSAGLIVEMPQTALGRLALGAFPPDDILARLPESPGEEVAGLLRTIFPLRHPHMYPPDRY